MANREWNICVAQIIPLAARDDRTLMVIPISHWGKYYDVLKKFEILLLFF